MRWTRAILTAFLALLLAACGTTYFKPVDDGLSESTQYDLDTLPFDRYWTGLVFNGAKIGFTRFELHALADGDFEIRSEAALRFHFLTIDKEATLKAADRIHPDLTIRDFEYDYDLDGNRLALRGTMSANELTVTVRSRDTVTEQRLATEGPVYPSSVIGLYPVVQGLAVGREFAYTVYDGETQQLAPVTQEVLGFEESELFEGQAFRVRTRMYGREVTTWIGRDGRPLLEQSMNGVFFAGLESESMATRYLALAALNKDETLLDFSVVRVQQPIPRPRDVSRLAVELSGLGGFPVGSGGLQTCTPTANAVRCEVARAAAPTQAHVETERWLQSTLPAPSRDPRVRALAREIVRDLGTDSQRIDALVAWIQQHVEQAAVDVFSALDVLATRKAECQGNTYLYTALARALGIPTRIVNGLVYSELVDGFVYHTWAESLVDGAWQAVDPTFGQTRADATHVQLIAGETLAEVAPMAALIGRLRARVLSYE